MENTKLAQAIAMTLAGGALTLGMVSNASATATTMYNMSTGSSGSISLVGNTTNPVSGTTWGRAGATDGWTNGATTGLGVGTASSQPWIVGGTPSLPTTATGPTGFGYTGAHLNWALEFTGDTVNVAEISTNDAFARYGSYADIDVAKGAWSATNTGATAGGWRHDLDVGLFKTDHTGTVSLSVDGIINTGAASNFGFTIFSGMDAVTDWGHHGGWNASNNTAGVMSPYTTGVQAGTGLPNANIIKYSTGGFPVGVENAPAPTGLNTITFEAVAGQTYTIFLGGYRNGTWGDTNDGYALTVSQVPVPAAAWLFGGAMVSLVGAIRRKRIMPV